jgi:hypothetical protein
MDRRLRPGSAGIPSLILVLVGGLMLPCGVGAQVQQPLPGGSATSRPGWIGIVYDAEVGGAPALRQFPGDHTGLLVKDVVEGSPALEAGLRPGDVLLALDGRPLASAFPGMLQVRDGQRILLRLLRDGAVVEAPLVAAPRPATLARGGGQERSARVDSLRVRIIQEMDSLLERDQRLGRSHSIVSIFRWEEEDGPMVVVRESPSPPATPSPPPVPGRGTETALPFRVQATTQREAPEGGETLVLRGWLSEGAGQDSRGLPFGAFVLSRDRVDGLVAELQAVRGSLEALRVQERARERELATELRTRGEGNPSDATLERVREAQRRLLEEAQRLEREMRLEGRRSIQRETPAPPAWTPASPPSPPARPPSPWVLGQRMVAGAEVTSLNPDLAEYFGGEEGLLVLQVLPGTPAADAGLQAGDVVTRLGDRRVRTVDQARGALEATPPGAIPVTLVRRGRSVLTTLPR